MSKQKNQINQPPARGGQDHSLRLAVAAATLGMTMGVNPNDALAIPTQAEQLPIEAVSTEVAPGAANIKDDKVIRLAKKEAPEAAFMKVEKNEQPVTVPSTMERPGKVNHKVKQPGKIPQKRERPGKVYPKVEQPGKVYPKMERPEKAFGKPVPAVIKQPGKTKTYWKLEQPGTAPLGIKAKPLAAPLGIKPLATDPVDK